MSGLGPRKCEGLSDSEGEAGGQSSAQFWHQNEGRRGNEVEEAVCNGTNSESDGLKLGLVAVALALG